MNSLPWMYQSHIAAAKIKQFETALQAIAGLDWSTMSPSESSGGNNNCSCCA
jgi:hypothetical protein